MAKRETGVLEKCARESNDSSDLFFEKPKILLIDLQEDLEEILRNAKLNVSKGSFGEIYKIQKVDGYQPIIDNSYLPEDFAEQDIIIIDVKRKDFILPDLYYREQAGSAEAKISAHCIYGLIDPRPLAMIRAREKLDRILLHGGIFIIFADVRIFLNLMINGKVIDKENGGFDNWSFLSILDKVDVKMDTVKEILPTPETQRTAISRLISKYAKSSSYLCDIVPFHVIKDQWVTLAVNKFKEPISGVICPKGDAKGWIFIFPQIGDKALFLNELINDILPDISPELFPFSKKILGCMMTYMNFPKSLN